MTATVSKTRRMAAYAAAGAAAAGVGAVASAQDFTGPYDHSNWTFNPGTGNGFFVSSPTTLSLTGNDDASGLPVDTLYTIAAAADGVVSFDWTYSSIDVGTWDYGGFYLNGTFTVLADNANQGSGFFSTNVMAGDIFGFFVFSEDGQFGPGVLDISNFSAPVPAPAALALLAVGGIAQLRRSRGRSA